MRCKCKKRYFIVHVRTTYPSGSVLSEPIIIDTEDYVEACRQGEFLAGIRQLTSGAKTEFIRAVEHSY